MERHVISQKKTDRAKASDHDSNYAPFIGFNTQKEKFYNTINFGYKV